MSGEKDGVGTADILADLRAELGTLEQCRLVRERDRGMLGPGACNAAGGDFTIEGEILRQTVASEQARIAELEAAIAALEAELPNSPQQIAKIWEQLVEKFGPLRQPAP